MATYKFGTQNVYYKENSNKFKSIAFTLQPNSHVSFKTSSEPGDADFLMYRFRIQSGLTWAPAEVYRYRTFVYAIAVETYEDINGDKFVRQTLLNCCSELTNPSQALINNVQIPSAGATLKKVEMLVYNNTKVPVKFSGFGLYTSYTAANAYTNQVVSDAIEDDEDINDDTGEWVDVFKSIPRSQTYGITLQKRGQTEWYGKTSRFTIKHVRYWNGSSVSDLSTGTLFDMHGNVISHVGITGGTLREYTEYLYFVPKDVDSLSEFVPDDGPLGAGMLIYLNTMNMYWKGSEKAYHIDLSGGTDLRPVTSNMWEYTQFDLNGETLYSHWLKTKGLDILANEINIYDETGDSTVYSNIINKFGVGLQILHAVETDGVTEYVDSGYRVGMTFGPRSGKNLGFSDTKETYPVLLNIMSYPIIVFVNVWYTGGFDTDVVQDFVSVRMTQAQYEAWGAMNTSEQISYLTSDISNTLASLATKTSITKKNYLDSLSPCVVTDRFQYYGEEVD